MSILDDMHNWLAQRNIGTWLGLKWDPAKDYKWQRKRQTERAVIMAEAYTPKLQSAETALARGDYQEASRTAYRALELVPDCGHPMTTRVRSKARSIISRLPPDIEAPPPTPKISPYEVVQKVMAANKLIDEGKLDEAKSLLQAISLLDIPYQSDEKLELAAWVAVAGCSMRIEEAKKNRPPNNKS
jgi:hypothetical protein